MAELSEGTGRDRYDFIVVGSGAGGGPLAVRLAEAGFTTLVLEAGPEHDCGYYTVPIMQAYASEDAHMRWDYFVRHWDEGERQRKDPLYLPDRGGVLYPRGSTVGGSTAVSAMITMYPHGSDWDRLAALTGDDGWSQHQMRERFERMEAWEGVDAHPLPGDTEEDRDRKAGHGRHGWLGTTRAAPEIAGREPMFLDVINAMEETSRERWGIPEDVPLPRDPNARDTPDDYQGMAFLPVSVRSGARDGSRDHLMDAAKRLDNLTILTDALVTRVLIDEDRAVGVEYARGAALYQASPLSKRDTASEPRRRYEVRCANEVILACGAFNTPQILKLSGIGPREELAQHGIAVAVDSPGVGRHLHDRYEVTVLVRREREYAIFNGSMLDLPAQDDDNDHLYAEWQRSRSGPFATNGSLASVIAKSSRYAGAESDLIVFAVPIDFHGYYPGYSKDTVKRRDMLSLVVLKGHTTNRAGSVELASADPFEPPTVRFRYLVEGDGDARADALGLAEGVELAREIYAKFTEASVVEEVIPGFQIQGEQVLEFVSSHAWGHHACGTAKIGSDDDPAAVLDGQFRVRGVAGLRVVDASVFPDIPGFFIALPTYLASDKAADDLIAEYQDQLCSTNSTGEGER